jgi:hypothetical protein
MSQRQYRPSSTSTGSILVLESWNDLSRIRAIAVVEARTMIPAQ